MRTIHMKFLSCMLMFVLGIGFVSAQTNAAPSTTLARNAEAQAVGGYSCAAVYGLSLGLGIASLSPCGIVCATAGWYMILALNNCK
jgi:hypothetical protein